MSSPSSVIVPVDGSRPMIASDELALPVALDAGDADDLAPVDGERHVIDERPVAPLGVVDDEVVDARARRCR